MFQPHLIDIEQPGVAGKQPLPIFKLDAKHPLHRNALLHHPIRAGRYPNGTVQTRRPLRRFKYVPRATVPFRKGDETVVPHTGTQRRSNALERMSPDRSGFLKDG
jgi:hypothetical protein